MKKLLLSLFVIAGICLPSFSATYTTNLNLKKPAHGEDVNTWDETVNSNMDIIDSSVAIIPVNLTSQVTGVLPSDKLVSTVAYTSKQNTWSDTNNFQTISASSGSFVGPVNIANLTANQCVQTGAGGLLTTSGASCGGGGGSSALAVNQNGVQVTSPTVAINALSPPFVVTAVGGGTTSQLALDGSSVTLHGNNVVFLQSTLQSGATFYVSSGTVSGQFSSNKVVTSTLSVAGDATIDAVRVTGTNGLTIDSLTADRCVQTTTGGKLTVSGFSCGSSSSGGDNLGSHVSTKTITAGYGISVTTIVATGLISGTTVQFTSATISNLRVSSNLTLNGQMSAVVNNLAGVSSVVGGYANTNTVSGSTVTGVAGSVTGGVGATSGAIGVSGYKAGTVSEAGYGGSFQSLGAAATNYGVWASATEGDANYGVYVDAGKTRLADLASKGCLGTDSNGVVIEGSCIGSGSVSVYPATATANFPYGMDRVSSISVPSGGSGRLKINNPDYAGLYQSGVDFALGGTIYGSISQYNSSSAGAYSYPIVITPGTSGGIETMFISPGYASVGGYASNKATFTIVGDASVGYTPATPPANGLYVQGSIKNAALGTSLGVCTDGSSQLTTSGCSFGSSGSSSLAVGTGTTSGWTGTITSSPTPVFLANSAQFSGTLQGGSTFFLSALSSSFTLQGNSITFTQLQAQDVAIANSTSTLLTQSSATVTYCHANGGNCAATGGGIVATDSPTLTGQWDWTNQAPSTFTNLVVRSTLTAAAVQLSGPGNFKFENPGDPLRYQAFGSTVDIPAGHMPVVGSSSYSLVDGGIPVSTAVASINSSGNPSITGPVTIAAGTGISLAQSGSTITVTNSSSGGSLSGGTTNYAMCWLSATTAGHCMSAVASNGSCTCIANQSAPLSPAISTVWYSSVAVTWTQVASDLGYSLEASSTNFSGGTLYSSGTTNGASTTLIVVGLSEATTYWMKVGSRWNDGTTTYANTVPSSTETLTAGGGSLTFVQSASFTYVAGQSKAETNSITVTAGNLLIVMCSEGSTDCTQSVTDTLGNTYTNILSTTAYNDAGVPNRCMGLFYAKNISGGSNVITCIDQVNWPSGETGAVLEYSGASTTAPYDVVSSSRQVNPAPNPDAGTVTTSVGNQLVVSCLMSYTDPSGAGSDTERARYDGGGAGYTTCQEEMVASVGTHSGSWTANAQYYAFGALQASFK